MTDAGVGTYTLWEDPAEAGTKAEATVSDGYLLGMGSSGVAQVAASSGSNLLSFEAQSTKAAPTKQGTPDIENDTISPSLASEDANTDILGVAASVGTVVSTAPIDTDLLRMGSSEAAADPSSAKEELLIFENSATTPASPAAEGGLLSFETDTASTLQVPKENVNADFLGDRSLEVMSATEVSTSSGYLLMTELPEAVSAPAAVEGELLEFDTDVVTPSAPDKGGTSANILDVKSDEATSIAKVSAVDEKLPQEEVDGYQLMTESAEEASGLPTTEGDLLAFESAHSMPGNDVADTSLLEVISKEATPKVKVTGLDEPAPASAEGELLVFESDSVSPKLTLEKGADTDLLETESPKSTTNPEVIASDKDQIKAESSGKAAPAPATSEGELLSFETIPAEYIPSTGAGFSSDLLGVGSAETVTDPKAESSDGDVLGERSTKTASSPAATEGDLLAFDTDTSSPAQAKDTNTESTKAAPDSAVIASHEDLLSVETDEVAPAPAATEGELMFFETDPTVSTPTTSKNASSDMLGVGTAELVTETKAERSDKGVLEEGFTEAAPAPVSTEELLAFETDAASPATPVGKHANTDNLEAESRKVTTESEAIAPGEDLIRLEPQKVVPAPAATEGELLVFESDTTSPALHSMEGADSDVLGFESSKAATDEEPAPDAAMGTKRLGLTNDSAAPALHARDGTDTELLGVESAEDELKSKDDGDLPSSSANEEAVLVFETGGAAPVPLTTEQEPLAEEQDAVAPDVPILEGKNSEISDTVVSLAASTEETKGYAETKNEAEEGEIQVAKKTVAKESDKEEAATKVSAKVETREMKKASEKPEDKPEAELGTETSKEAAVKGEAKAVLEPAKKAANEAEGEANTKAVEADAMKMTKEADSEIKGKGEPEVAENASKSVQLRTETSEADRKASEQAEAKAKAEAVAWAAQTRARIEAEVRARIEAEAEAEDTGEANMWAEKTAQAVAKVEAEAEADMLSKKETKSKAMVEEVTKSGAGKVEAGSPVLAKTEAGSAVKVSQEEKSQKVDVPKGAEAGMTAKEAKKESKVEVEEAVDGGTVKAEAASKEEAKTDSVAKVPQEETTKKEDSRKSAPPQAKESDVSDLANRKSRGAGINDFTASASRDAQAETNAQMSTSVNCGCIIW